MKKDTKPNLQALLEHLSGTTTYAARYAVVLFLVLLLAVYGFVLLKITAYSNAEPSPDAITAQVKAAATPHVSQSVVQQMQSLQDHSVGVQSLFDQARSNPFQE